MAGKNDQATREKHARRRAVILGAGAALLLAAATAVFVSMRRPAEGPDNDGAMPVISELTLPEGVSGESVVRSILERLELDATGAGVAVDYPLPGSLFPPDICSPTILWHDASESAEAWLIDISFATKEGRLCVLTHGKPPRRPIDRECITGSNTWTPTEYQRSARGWRPSEETWSVIKRLSVDGDATITIRGLAGIGRDPSGARAVSSGSVAIRTSSDPVGAPIFYRDVPLMPVPTETGAIKPIHPAAITLIQWRLRDLSKREAPAVMQHMPTCANCHSFSADGRTLAMDMDGPSGDKGAHVVADVRPQMVIEKDEVFSWNQYERRPDGNLSYGLFPQVSPDGRHVAATIHETLYVRNYADYKFLQTFYPTRGIIAIYDRQTREIHPLSGADDPEFVQTNPVWSPDGTELLFLRAKARDLDAESTPARFANDPNELRIRYDVWRIPFNGGKGGTPRPVAGASDNGKSNSFPRYTPDGKWIVYVQAANGLLMRPDGRLHIIPSAGGESRELGCNTDLMNSWHSFSPDGRWMVFSSKSDTPYTQMYLTHIDEEGNATPPILVPDSTAANRAVNLPEFADFAPDAIVDITTPAVDYRRHFDKATALLERGDMQGGLAELRRSIELKDDYPPAYSAMAGVLGNLGQNAEAVESSRRAIALNPMYAPAYMNLGLAYNRLGKPREAVDFLRKAIDINPKYYPIRHSLAASLDAAGRTEEAIAEYERVLQADSDYVPTRVNLGALYLRLGNADLAARHLLAAVEIDPGEAAAHQNLGLALMEQGKHDEALACFSRTAELNPRLDAPHEASAMACLRMNKPRPAADAFRRAIRINPNNIQAHNGLAWLLATCPEDGVRDGEEALRLASIACQRTGGRDPVCLLTLAAACAESSRFEDAEKAAQQALSIARANGHEQLIRAITAGIESFRSKQPIRMK